MNGGAITVGEKKLDLSHKLGAKTSAYEGKEIIFGFRPEAARLAARDDVSEAYKMRCVVELVELLGDNTNVYADLSGIKSIVKVDPHDSPKVAEEFEFYIPYSSIYLFDKQTTRRIKTRVS